MVSRAEPADIGLQSLAACVPAPFTTECRLGTPNVKTRSPKGLRAAVRSTPARFATTIAIVIVLDFDNHSMNPRPVAVDMTDCGAMADFLGHPEMADQLAPIVHY